MDAGTLRDLVSISTPTTSQDAAGQTTTAHNTSDSVSAGVRQMPGNEQIRNGLSGQDETYAIRIRWRDDVDNTTRITYRGRALEVSSVIEGGHGNREWLDIVAKRTK